MRGGGQSLGKCRGRWPGWGPTWQPSGVPARSCLVRGTVRCLAGQWEQIRGGSAVQRGRAGPCGAVTPRTVRWVSGGPLWGPRAHLWGAAVAVTAVSSQHWEVSPCLLRDVPGQRWWRGDGREPPLGSVSLWVIPLLRPQSGGAWGAIAHCLATRSSTLAVLLESTALFICVTGVEIRRQSLNGPMLRSGCLVFLGQPQWPCWPSAEKWLCKWLRGILVSWNTQRLKFPSNSCYSVSQLCLFVTQWTVAHQASLSITNSRSSPKLMSVESVMPSNHLILCHPLLPLSIFPSIRVFSNESVLHIRWPEY